MSWAQDLAPWLAIGLAIAYLAKRWWRPRKSSCDRCAAASSPEVPRRHRLPVVR